jgi:hypothetical protein
MLTALAVVAGATVILADPIFQGLAIALMAGSLVSMFTAPVLVPLLYYMANHRKETPKQGNCGDASKCCGGSKENVQKSCDPKGD